MQLERAQHPFRTRYAHDDGVGRADEERGGEHRQDHRRKHRLRQRLGKQARQCGERQEDEAELSALRERKRDTQRRAGGRAESLGQPGDEDELARDQHDEQREHEARMRRHHAHVEQHAHADEEQPQQHVTVGLDVLFHLEAVFGLGDQHAGEKRPENEGQAGEAGEEREQQDDEQHVEHEQLGRPKARNGAEPTAHQARPGEHH